MINIHLNGDIVRCPDMKDIQNRAKEIRDSREICKYGIKEETCSAWQSSLINFQRVKNKNSCGRCPLSGFKLCPEYKRRVDLGKKQKRFKIDNSTYRKMASTAHYLVKESKNKVLFLTLTFGQFKDDRFNNYLLLKQSEKNEFEKEVNQAFSRFVENLRKNYNCGGYIAVREFGKDTHRIHFHILCSMPFVPFASLNAAWCSAIGNISSYSKNAVTSDPKTKFITNPVRAMRYVCKYFSKSKGQSSETRLTFVSNNIIQRPKFIVGSYEDIMNEFKFDYIKQTSDFTTCFRITDNIEFQRFCREFLYPFFELSADKNQSLYAFPHNSS